MTKCLPFWMASASALLLSLPADGALIDYDFTDSDQVGEWEFSTESTTDGVGSQGWVGPGTQFNFGPHDGVMRWRPHHTDTSGDQAAIGWVDISDAMDLSGWELQTTGIGANRAAVAVSMLVIYEDNGDARYAVSDDSIRTSTGESSPIPGQWGLDDLTFRSLDPDDLLAGPGAEVDTSSVLANVTGVGYYSAFEGQSWMADHATQIDSFTVIPEPASLALLGLGGLVLLRRRRS